MKRIAMILTLATCLALGLGAAAETGAPNLLPDPGFERAVLAPDSWEGTWLWYRLAGPSAATLDKPKGAVTLTGGRTLLHSSRFEVEPETFYRISVDARGTGEVSVECLWWDKNRGIVRPHRTVAAKPVAVAAETEAVTGDVESPPHAHGCTVRIAVANGTVEIWRPVVRPAPAAAYAGTLMLALDAADPGPDPAKSWRDLTGKNLPFVAAGSPTLTTSAAGAVYRFAGSGDRFEGAAAEEAHFDFETKVAAGAGNGDPFTVVFYGSVAGPCPPGMINKTVQLDRERGWTASLYRDQWNLYRVEACLTGGATGEWADATRIRFPGGAENPKPKSLAHIGVDATRPHLYVLHFTGKERAKAADLYIDGRTAPCVKATWAFGFLQHTILNDAPLRIGALPGAERGFAGEIGFIEIWAGKRLLEGLKAPEYSGFRWNNGKPARGLITSAR